MHRLRRAPLLLTLLAACDLPRDADGTLAHVRHGTLRVGVVPAAPWVTDSAGVVGGIEALLVQRVAAELGARVVWVRRSESELLEGLHARQLDLVIAGLTKRSPWSKQVALTCPYYVDTMTVGVAPGVAPGAASGSGASIAGMQVAVDAGDAVAAAVKKQGAVPVVVSDAAHAGRPAAMPTWRAVALGLQPMAVRLGETPHVVAAPPGENAWLVHVERRLSAYGPLVARTLRAPAR